MSHCNSVSTDAQRRARQTSFSAHPRSSLNARASVREAAAAQFVLHRSYQQASRPVHCFPVVLVSRSTSQANLIVTAVLVDPRPREAVRATLAKQQLQEFHELT